MASLSLFKSASRARNRLSFKNCHSLSDFADSSPFKRANLNQSEELTQAESSPFPSKIYAPKGLFRDSSLRSSTSKIPWSPSVDASMQTMLSPSGGFSEVVDNRGSNWNSDALLHRSEEEENEENVPSDEGAEDLPEDVHRRYRSLFGS